MFRYTLELTQYNRSDEQNFVPLRHFLETSPVGEYVCTVQRKQRRRTTPQNKYLWGVVYPMLLTGLQQAGWEFTNCEQVHHFFKQQVAGEHIINYKTGEVVTLPNSTAAMTTQEFETYVDRLRRYAEQYLNIEIPEPNHNENEILRM